MARLPLLVAALVALAPACSTDSPSGTQKPDSGGHPMGNPETGGVTVGGAAGATGGEKNTGGASAGGAGGGTAGQGGTGTGGSAAAGTGGGAGAGTGSGAGAGSGGRGSGGRGSGGASNGGSSGNGGGQSGADAGTPRTIDHYVTFYGWPDNDPAGNGIAYPKLHQGASGTGTFADPITFATDPKEWPAGTILYVPYLKRYVIMEDSCAECITDWKSGKYHIDLWLDSDGTHDSQVLACENTLTRTTTPVEVDPPADRPVDATPLFDLTTGKCNAP